MDDLISSYSLLARFPDGDDLKPFEVREIVRTEEAVDAVQVVRCGECKHYMTDPDSYFQCDLGNGLCHPKPFDYCSYGERKER